MNPNINDGRPSMHMPWNVQRSHEGISIRDYFAAAALQGIVSNTEASKTLNQSDVARFCYLQADAMIKAREVQ